MKRTTKTLSWMVAASVVAMALVLVCLHHKFYGPVVGSGAVTLIWMWAIFKLAAALDADLAHARLKKYEAEVNKDSDS